MEHRPSPLAAAAAGVVALLACLAFGNDTYLEKVARWRTDGGARAVAQVLAFPNWSRSFAGPDASGPARYAFLILFPLATALLVLATSRGATGFVAGWTAAVAAGAVAGFVRGLAVSDSYGFIADGSGSSVQVAFLVAGQGASFGLVIGWAVGLGALLGSLVGRTPVAAVSSTAPGFPPPPTGPAPLAWSPTLPGGDAPAMAAGRRRGRTSGVRAGAGAGLGADEPTASMAAARPSPPAGGPSGWERPSDPPGSGS